MQLNPTYMLYFVCGNPLDINWTLSTQISLYNTKPSFSLELLLCSSEEYNDYYY